MWTDLLGLCGFAALVCGLWWIYPPSALIVGGTLLCGLAAGGAVNRRRQEDRTRAKRERARYYRNEPAASEFGD
jgi:hypothetical protein